MARHEGRHGVEQVGPANAIRFAAQVSARVVKWRFGCKRARLVAVCPTAAECPGDTRIAGHFLTPVAARIAIIAHEHRSIRCQQLLSLAAITAVDTDGSSRQHGVEFSRAAQRPVLARVRASLARQSCARPDGRASGSSWPARAEGDPTSGNGYSIPRPTAAHPTLGASGRAGMDGALHPRMARPDKRS
jgi:hypothetical protein